MNVDIKIPKEVLKIVETLEKADFEAYPVGGCVRDLFLGKEPKDWDITTNAKPEEIQKIFSGYKKSEPDKLATVYENDFGTVGVKTDSKDDALKIVEVTTFRVEGRYSDSRHPDEVRFAKTVEEDLSRRDFTINAMALEVGGGKLKSESFKIIDPYGGQEDLENKIIKAVGNAEKRFEEDALRMMRAVRLAAQLEFKIEEKTEEAIRGSAHLLKRISKERVRDEFSKAIMCDSAAWGVRMFQNLGLMEYFMPELVEGVGISQNKHHIYTVWEHNVLALEYAAKKNYSFEIRIASLLHDVGKPRAKKGEGVESTFYQHEYVGASMTKKILENLKFSKNIVDYVTHLVRYHLFYYNVGEVTDAGVRRFLARVGPQNVDDLLKVREADRIGSGVPKAFPYKLRHLLFMIDKVKRDPISPKMLKINGNDLIKLLSIEPGPKIGHILNALLDEVIEDPSLNSKKQLEEIAKKLSKLSQKELEDLRKRAEKNKEEFEAGVENEIKRKHKV
jgi:poly(A) polymerase/tRNA nucleotidyltransferase (CCA-adding enzyme)